MMQNAQFHIGQRVRMLKGTFKQKTRISIGLEAGLQTLLDVVG
jgi:hypothetical protein